MKQPEKERFHLFLLIHKRTNNVPGKLWIKPQTTKKGKKISGNNITPKGLI